MNPLHLTEDQRIGYSGGKALYAAHYSSFLLLFEITIAADVMIKTIHYSTLN